MDTIPFLVHMLFCSFCCYCYSSFGFRGHCLTYCFQFPIQSILLPFLKGGLQGVFLTAVRPSSALCPLPFVSSLSLLTSCHATYLLCGLNHVTLRSILSCHLF